MAGINPDGEDISVKDNGPWQEVDSVIARVRATLFPHFGEAILRRQYGIYSGFVAYKVGNEYFVDHHEKLSDDPTWGIEPRHTRLIQYEEKLSLHFKVERVYWNTDRARLKILEK